MKKEPCSVCGDMFAPNSYKQKRCDPCRFKKAVKRVRDHPKTHETYRRVHPDSIQWRVVPGYEGRYEISNQGAILSIINNRRRILHPTKRPWGYKTILTDRYGEMKSWLVHRLMLMVFCPIDHPETYITECIGNDKHDLSLPNWRWVKDAGQFARAGKLTDKDVQQIRQRLMNDITLKYADIAKEYNVGKSTIGRIMAGGPQRGSWTHVK